MWAPVGERPIAIGHHRFEWLYVIAFVEPVSGKTVSGKTVWHVASGIGKDLFELMLADFARSTGVGANKRIVLVIDNAGWHGPENLAVPDGLRLVYQPPHSPELQPAECLWTLVDEPLLNRYFNTLDDLDKTVGDRCLALTEQRQTVRDRTLFHWWPKPTPKK